MSATAYFDEMIDRFGMAEYFIRKDQLSRHPLASTSQDILEIIRRTADEYADPFNSRTPIPSVRQRSRRQHRRPLKSGRIR